MAVQDLCPTCKTYTVSPFHMCSACGMKRETWRRTYLKWFRDQGRGQEASDACNDKYPTAISESMDGSWPIATLEFDGESDRDEKWTWLLKTFQVNAMGWYC